MQTFQNTVMIARGIHPTIRACRAHGRHPPALKGHTGLMGRPKILRREWMRGIGPGPGVVIGR
jgi:hypothetical protein